MKKALLIVDIQNDFMPGGALGVSDGHLIIPLINQLQEKFDMIIATKDWHPKNHLSFASQHVGKKAYDSIILDGIEQTLWPDHCVQNSYGADFHSDLSIKKISKIIYKGMNRNVDSYSGFWDNNKKDKTELGEYLRALYIDSLYIVGLAIDYCVKYTALDGIKAGFNIYVIEEACQGVNLKKTDTSDSIREMITNGIQIIHSNALF